MTTPKPLRNEAKFAIAMMKVYKERVKIWTRILNSTTKIAQVYPCKEFDDQIDKIESIINQDQYMYNYYGQILNIIVI